MRRVLIALLVILAAVPAAVAQERDAEAEAALARAVEVDGVPAEHYSFAVKDNFLYGTATFELFLTETDAGVERIILETTPADQEPNRVTYTRIGEIINVQTP